MQLKSTLILGLLALFSTISFAQERYVDEVFTDAEIVMSSDVHYATNATILPLLFLGATEFLPEELFFDVYEPDQGIDMVTDRPVVIVAHGGDGLPQFVNTVCWGDKSDWHTVAIARKLARMGYVAVVPNYRLGWNPLAMAGDDFLDGLVDAGFRVQQDFKACARYLRKDAAEDGNAYAIDADNIALWGVSTSAGTYALTAGYISDIEETQTETYFVTDDMGNIRNVVDIDQLGDLDGTTVGMLPNGDTTNYVNTLGYSSDFQMIIAASGISLDPGALDVGEPPLVMIGNPNSLITQFPIGPVTLPSTGAVVAFVQLSQGVITEANEKGLNQEWIDAGLIDDYSMSQQMDPNFGAQEGWYPVYGEANNDYPYIWWDPATCPEEQNTNSQDGFPGANEAYALSQIDSMTAYVGARACITFDLGCAGITSTREPLADQLEIRLSPNPTDGMLRLETISDVQMEEVLIYSIEGKLLQRYVVENTIFRTDALQLPAGYYSVLIRTEVGIVTKKLVVK